MTADGHVTVITKSDVSRGDKAVYDVSRDIAIITGMCALRAPTAPN